ncbi:tripartite tricarboxylate transporter TctB family protein [Paracoccus laeviglucosivorans]|uniref:Tripartite tricarboxylate transporter TctB family protein n=1 Tax=Paracoccus laeviglucosivorans TaxID=1197861 RepID=A0A521FN11_9RHOB|nr:tripartite tricarboxylate transporter TctB family protein [Paracoccus laeviglucosivorans]SMO97529.1 Tripartite tricarboxylate transporter TctB family protein [Paracoccus laeviglucosivorans]
MSQNPQPSAELKTHDPPAGRGGRLLNQNLIGGLCLIGLAGAAFLSMSGLASGTLRAMGPGGMPRGTALLIALIGAGMLIVGVIRGGEPIPRIATRGPLIIMLALIVFALTIRPTALGSFTSPGIGIVGAGPLAIMIAGFAERDRNWLDLGILAGALTAFCILLFGYLLNLPMPAFPVSWLKHFPGWSQREVMLLVSCALLAVALVLFLVRRGRKSEA